MFDRFLGLPLHPLLVHAAVIFVPLLAFGGVLYAVAPFTRRHFRWPLILLALAGPGSVFAAKLAGDAFRTHKNLAAPQLQQKIAQHSTLGMTTLWLVLALGVAVLVLAWAAPVERAAPAVRRQPDDTLVTPRRIGAGMLTQVVIGVVVVGLAAASLYYVFRAGDTGARMVWTGF